MENKYIINVLRRQQRTDKFKIVDTFPLGYIVWPIGRENFPFPGYIPLAKPHREKKYYIDPESLAALRCEKSDAILRLASQTTITREIFLKITNESDK